MTTTFAAALAALLVFGAPIPEGTNIPVTVDESIPIDRDRFGDTFEAHVTRDVVVNGDVVIAEGAPAEVKLVESGDQSEAATLRLASVWIDGDRRSVSTEDAKVDTGRDGKKMGKKAAIGAAAGAVVGAVTGAGVIEGAVVGAGGGLAWSLLKDKDHEVDDGTQLEFSLENEVKDR